MKPFRWSAEKSLILEAERAISFERIVVAIGDGGVLDVYEHPRQERYPNQRVLVVHCDGYAFLVPYVEAEDHLFLKAIIPSRRATRDHLRSEDETKGQAP